MANYEKTVFDLALALDFDGPMGEQAKAVAIAAVAVAGLVLCACLCCCVRRCKRGRASNQVEVVALVEEADEEELKQKPAKVADRTPGDELTVEADPEDGGTTATAALQAPAAG